MVRQAHDERMKKDFAQALARVTVQVRGAKLAGPGLGSLAETAMVMSYAGIELRTADRDTLIALIVRQRDLIIRQQAIIEGLEKRVAQLEGRVKSKGSARMPGLKPKADGKADQPQKPRKRRPYGFARTRMTPTQRVEHVLEQCPDCGTQLSGGSTRHTREVIDLPQVPVAITEHAYIARTCRRRCVPPAQLEGVVLGKQRLGINLLSLIVALREEGRLPFRVIRRYLDAVHGLRLSVGAIVAATQRVAQKAQTVMTDIVERFRGSPVVHADETGWREDGHNGYVWTFSTPDLRYFSRRGRSKAVVDEALGQEFAGVLVSDCYAAYHHYDGPKQRCWAHLLRDIHDQRALYPRTDHQHGGLMRSTMLYRQGQSLHHTRQNGSDTAPNRPWNTDCWPSVALTWPTQRQPRPGCAGAWRSPSRACPVLDTGNSSSLWPNRMCRRTTMRPSAACGRW